MFQINLKNFQFLSDKYFDVKKSLLTNGWKGVTTTDNVYQHNLST